MTTKNYLYTLYLVAALSGKLCAAETLEIADRYAALAERLSQASSASTTTAASQHADPRASVNFLARETETMRKKAEFYRLPLASVSEVLDVMMERCITETQPYYAPQTKSLLHYVDAKMGATGLTMSLGISLNNVNSASAAMQSGMHNTNTVNDQLRQVLGRVISQVATILPEAQSELLRAATPEIAMNACVLPVICSISNKACHFATDLDRTIDFRRHTLSMQMLSSSSSTPTVDPVQATALAELERERDMLSPLLQKVEEFIKALKRTGQLS